LEIQNRQLRGRIYIEDGSIIHSVLGDEHGEKAFQKLLAMSGGEFKLQPFEAPEVRTIEGSWEFLLMEAARVADELASQAPAEAAVIEADFSNAPAVAEATPDVVVAETLISSAQGELIYQWQCGDVLARTTFLQTVSQQAGLLAQSLPIGTFERLEILQASNRAVAQISHGRMVFVRVASLVIAP
jgi:hypothetical protein